MEPSISWILPLSHNTSVRTCEELRIAGDNNEYPRISNNRDRLRTHFQGFAKQTCVPMFEMVTHVDWLVAVGCRIATAISIN